jgi:hypothetical protein
MWEGYMDLGGQEIVNSARAYAYGTAAGLTMACEPCEAVPAAVGDGPYYSPQEDGAPWYDPTQLESADFLGVLGLGAVGLGSAPVSRTPVELVGPGSALGPLRRTAREMAFTVALIVRDEAALSYALAWLAATLRGSSCSFEACGGAAMCMFSACPQDSDTGDLPGTAQLRHLYDVGLLDGPTLGEVKRVGTAFQIAEVTFTLVAGKPWIYREPLVTSPAGWVTLGDSGVVRFDPDSVYAACAAPVPCLTDPHCPAPPLPPRPPVPVSPCYPTGIDNFRRTVVQLDALDAPDWLELVPVLEVATGSDVMRRLTIRFWANAQNLPCDQVTDPCSACLDITVAYLPPGATLTLDARVQRSVVDCPQGTIGSTQSTPVLYGAQGRAMQWPAFECPTGLCIEILSKFDATAPDARARVSLVPRQDAG